MSFRKVIEKYGRETPYQIQVWELFAKIWAPNHVKITKSVFVRVDDKEVKDAEASYNSERNKEIVKRLEEMFAAYFENGKFMEEAKTQSPIVMEELKFDAKNNRLVKTTIFDSGENSVDMEWQFKTCKRWAKCIVLLEKYCNLRLEHDNEMGYHYIWTDTVKNNLLKSNNVGLLLTSCALSSPICAPAEELKSLTTSSVKYNDDKSWGKKRGVEVGRTNVFGFLCGPIVFVNHNCSAYARFAIFDTRIFDILGRVDFLKPLREDFLAKADEKTLDLHFKQVQDALKNWKALDPKIQTALEMQNGLGDEILYKGLKMVILEIEARFHEVNIQRDESLGLLLEGVTVDSCMPTSRSRLHQLELMRPTALTMQQSHPNEAVEYLGKRGEQFFIRYGKRCSYCALNYNNPKYSFMKCQELAGHITQRKVWMANLPIITPLRVQLENVFRHQKDQDSPLIIHFNATDSKVWKSVENIKKTNATVQDRELIWLARNAFSPWPDRGENSKVILFHEPGVEAILKYWNYIRTRKMDTAVPFDQSVMLEDGYFWSTMADQGTPTSKCYKGIYRLTKIDRRASKTAIPIAVLDRSRTEVLSREDICYFNLNSMLGSASEDTAKELLDRFELFFLSRMISLLNLHEEIPKEPFDVYMTVFNPWGTANDIPLVGSAHPQILALIGIMGQYMAMAKLRETFKTSIRKITMYIDGDRKMADFVFVYIVPFLFDPSNSNPMSDLEFFEKLTTFFKDKSGQYLKFEDILEQRGAIFSGVDDTTEKLIESTNILEIEDKEDADNDKKKGRPKDEDRDSKKTK